MECYHCESIKNNIVLYYLIGQYPEYINVQSYDNPIPDQAKPICQDCVVNFLLVRQQGLQVCKTCQKINCQKCKNDDLYERNRNYCRSMKCQICQENVHNIKLNEQDQCCAWANVYEPNIFNYGLNGMYKFVGEEIIAHKGVICCKCLENYKYEPYNSVECSKCKTKYQSAVPRSKGQGFHCASTVYDYGIRGEYGSYLYDFDEVMLFAKERPKDVKYKSCICDACITNLIETGVLVGPREILDEENHKQQHINQKDNNQTKQDIKKKPKRKFIRNQNNRGFVISKDFTSKFH
ncbi:hypothetical protein QLL95_gp0448 [Cotonvirus japonicus]|uniref:RING-type domain-containing protein n=1 Tax=Cotonvirus japonicus TaxID=2811091 RepID=A0ABM7NU31_9VIRU|nr:hypothetical protein QLL95_gp0448 [Cotonvirus japonicus]BCS83675.1 hypothetical protein [Cotonvirus japonicus]